MARKIRKQNNAFIPPGISSNFAYEFPGGFKGYDCLQPVNKAIVEEILRGLEEEHGFIMDWGVPPEFVARAETAHARFLGYDLKEIKLEEGWVTFIALLNLI